MYHARKRLGAGAINVKTNTVSGISSALAGGDFFTGMASGIISSGLNHAMHAGARGVDDAIMEHQEKKRQETKKSYEQNKKFLGGRGKLTGEDKAVSQGSNTNYENGDGYIDYEEVYWTYKLCGGQVDLFADISQLDLSTVHVSDFPNGVGSSELFNFAGAHFTNVTQAVVYGSITLRLLPGNRVIGHSDTYNFDIKHSSLLRDVLTAAGNMYNGSGTQFQIHFTGAASIMP